MSGTEWIIVGIGMVVFVMIVSGLAAYRYFNGEEEEDEVPSESIKKEDAVPSEKSDEEEDELPNEVPIQRNEKRNKDKADPIISSSIIQMSSNKAAGKYFASPSFKI